MPFALYCSFRSTDLYTGFSLPYIPTSCTIHMYCVEIQVISGVFRCLHNITRSAHSGPNDWREYILQVGYVSMNSKRYLGREFGFGFGAGHNNRLGRETEHRIQIYTYVRL